ncbi:MAG TPA: hemerythrin domain-containing protein [Mycobacteriales bacterium]
MADVVDVLVAQHALVEDLFRETVGATGEARRQTFDELVRVLALHEAAEQEVVHPLARAHLDSPAVVDGRLQEESLATQLVAELVQLGPDAEEFDVALLELRAAVLTHARHEERYEFPWLRHTVPAEELVSLVAAVRAVEGITAGPATTT